MALYDLEENATKVSVNKNQFESSSESDTDDEIQRLEESKQYLEFLGRMSLSNVLYKYTERTSIDKIKQKTYDEKQCMNGSLTEVKLAPKTSGDIYDASTDEEEYLQYKLKPQLV